MAKDTDTYFVNDQKVTRQDYMNAERNAGFYPKTPGTPATASFTGKGIKGRIEYGS